MLQRRGEVTSLPSEGVAQERGGPAEPPFEEAPGGPGSWGRWRQPQALPLRRDLRPHQPLGLDLKAGTPPVSAQASRGGCGSEPDKPLGTQMVTCPRFKVELT